MAILKKILQNENRPLSVKNQTVKRLNFNVYATAATAGTAVTQPAIDPMKVYVKAVLNQPRLGVHEHIVLDGYLAPYALADNILDSAWYYTYANATGYAALITVANAVGVKEVSVLPFAIDLPEGIVLKGSDELIITTRVENGAVAASADSALTYVGVVVEEGICNPEGLPVILQKVLDVSQNDFEFAFGDNVKMMAIINLDKTSILDSANILTNVRMMSDRLNYDAQYEEMLTRRLNMYPSANDPNERDQNFVLAGPYYGDEEIDDVRLKITVDSSNVTANKNFLVVKKVQDHSAVLGDALVRAQKHSLKRHNKKGFSKVMNRLR